MAMLQAEKVEGLLSKKIIGSCTAGFHVRCILPPSYHFELHPFALCTNGMQCTRTSVEPHNGAKMFWKQFFIYIYIHIRILYQKSQWKEMVKLGWKRNLDP